MGLKAVDLREDIYRKIKESILDGVIKPGSWLQEDQVSSMLAVSRTPVREAFNRLRGEGLVQIVPRKGARVIDMSGAQIDSLFETRAHIELTYFETSAAVLTLDDYEKFRHELCDIEKKLLNSLVYSEEWEGFRKTFNHIDRSFHDKFILACGNEYWIKMYFQIRDLVIVSSNGRSLAEETVKGAIQEHHGILDALMEGGYAEAKKQLAMHILKTRYYADQHLRQERMKLIYNDEFRIT